MSRRDGGRQGTGAESITPPQSYRTVSSCFFFYFLDLSSMTLSLGVPDAEDPDHKVPVRTTAPKGEEAEAQMLKACSSIMKEAGLTQHNFSQHNFSVQRRKCGPAEGTRVEE